MVSSRRTERRVRIYIYSEIVCLHTHVNSLYVSCMWLIPWDWLVLLYLLIWGRRVLLILALTWHGPSDASALCVPLAPSRWGRAHARALAGQEQANNAAKPIPHLPLLGALLFFYRKLCLIVTSTGKVKKKKSSQCIQFIASSSANRLDLLIAIPSVKFRKGKKKKKKSVLMPLLKWAVASTPFPCWGRVANGWAVVLGDDILWEGVGGEHGN